MGVTWGLGGVLVAGIMAVTDRLGRPDLAFAAFAATALLAGLACLRLPVPGGLPTASIAPKPRPEGVPGVIDRVVGVTLVGAGPGDPGLLTRAGASALGRADVVIYDHLIDQRLLDLARPDADRIFAGKRRDRCPIPQDEINAMLVRYAREGRSVVRLKGGDPFVFGRGPRRRKSFMRRASPSA